MRSKTRTTFILLLLAAVSLLSYYILIDGMKSPSGGVVIEILPGSYTDEFFPRRVEVVLGVNSTVTWVNDERTRDSHDVVDSGGLFRSPLLKPGQSYTYTFTNPGKYMYYCTPHPWMTGEVVVRAR